MKRISLAGALLLVGLLSGNVNAAESTCSATVKGYRVVSSSVSEFVVGDAKHCFFAFYTENSYRQFDMHGDGNPGDAIWYGYYRLGGTVKEFDKPSGEDVEIWQSVCDLEAVSFIDINADQQNDVTVIGTCLKSAHLYRRYFVFLRKGNDFVLDEDVYYGLLGENFMKVDDLKKYIAEQAQSKKSDEKPK